MSNNKEQPNYHYQTQIVHDKDQTQDQYGAVVQPIYQTSLFTFDSWQEIEQAFEDKINNAIYTRGCNPTVQLAEKKIANLAGGEKAKLFGSGMAAISAGMLHFLSEGDHVVTLKNIYGPCISLLKDLLTPKMNIETSFISGIDIEEFEQAIKANTKLIYIESPTSAIFTIQNLKQIAELGKRHGIATMIDNTWATPLYQKTLNLGFDADGDELGIDLEVHSCSKYLSGHSDIVAGVLIGSTELIDAIHVREYELLGAKIAPVEASLLIRSLRTLDMRMARHQENALKVAHFLDSHPKISQVNYPGLVSFPQYELAKEQMIGFSGLMSFRFECNELVQVQNFFNSLKLFQIGVSWGGHESLIYAPAIGYLKEHSSEQFAKMGLSLGDMRISVGLENVDDLITDLATSLATI